LKKQQQFGMHAKVALDRLLIIKKKVERRDKLLLDLDGHKAKLQTAKDQNKQDVIQKEETRCRELQQQYETINSELKQHITSEVDYLDQYFTKELKLLHSRQREIYFAMAESFKTIMDAETLIQIGSGSFVVSTESQYIPQASPNLLPEQSGNATPTEQQPQKAPSSPSLIGKIKTGTTNRITSMIEKKPSSSSSASTSSPTPVATTAASTTTAATPAQNPTPPPKPAAKPSLNNSTEVPPKRAPPTIPNKPQTTTVASPAPEPVPEEPQPTAPQPQPLAPEPTGELDISEYHYEYTTGTTSSSLIANEKRKTVANPRMSTMFDTFSTTNAFGNPKDFSGMFGSDSPT